jgi:agmatinase
MHKQFLDLEPHFTCKNKSEIIILPVGFDKTTTYMQGTDKGPKAIIEASKYLELYDIETDFEVYEKGIYTEQENEYHSSKEMLDSVYENVLTYLKKDKFVVTLGGEHSISLAPIKAHAEHYKSISVLHLDAHADLAPAYRGDKYSHGSVMARVQEIPSISNIVSVGIRSMAKEEKKYINKKNTFFAHNLEDGWEDKAVNLLSDQVYITFDIDALDPSLVPSTGTPEPGGLMWNQAMKLLKKVADKKNIIGFDLVELSPIKNIIAPDFLAAKIVYKLLSYIFYQR